MIGISLKTYREKVNMSVSDLNRSSGVARGYIHELESGKYDNPSLIVICKLCKGLKCTPNDLIPENMYK